MWRPLVPLATWLTKCHLVNPALTVPVLTHDVLEVVPIVF